MIFFHHVVESHTKIHVVFRGGNVVKDESILGDAFDCQEIEV